MRISEALAGAELVYVTPGHQSPTNVTMSMERRLSLLAAAETHDFAIIEDDYEHELNFIGAQKPSLRGFDRTGRVIHVASLSKPLFPGLRLGFVSADAAIIAELRALRRLMFRHPSALDQRAMALFLAEGHYDSHIRRQRKTLSAKWNAILRGIDKHLPTCHVTMTTGGSAVWLQLPATVTAETVQDQAAQEGILVEAGDVHYHGPDTPKNRLRLGFAAIPLEKIAPGLERLGRIVERLTPLG